jgi:DNA-directed RNA polymerase specialized sigma24 family protein
MADRAALFAEHYADVHNCYQDAFVAACQITPRDPADWGRILARLATRKAVDLLRKRIRSAQVGPLDVEREPATDDDPVQSVRLAKMLDKLRAGLAELPGKQAEVVWLRCVEGLVLGDPARHRRRRAAAGWLIG